MIFAQLLELGGFIASLRGINSGRSVSFRAVGRGGRLLETGDVGRLPAIGGKKQPTAGDQDQDKDPGES